MEVHHPLPYRLKSSSSLGGELHGFVNGSPADTSEGSEAVPQSPRHVAGATFPTPGIDDTSRDKAVYPVGFASIRHQRRDSIYTTPSTSALLLYPPSPDTPGVYPLKDKYLIDARERIGSTVLAHAWDTSVSPNVRLTTQIIPSTQYAEFLQREGRVLAVLRSAPHRNLPTLVGCADPDPNGGAGAGAGHEDGHLFLNPLYGNLYSEAQKSSRPMSEILRVFEQMVAPVAHCHQLRIVLGNIKLGKFMWSDRDQQTVQIADLSGSQVVSPGEQCNLSWASGSPAYIAPEMLHEEPTYDGFAADVWSLGVVCHVLCTGTYPFEDTSSTRLFRKIKSGAIDYPADMPESIVELLKQMLCRDPDERLTASQLAAHPVFVTARKEREATAKAGTNHVVPCWNVSDDSDALADTSASDIDDDTATRCPPRVRWRRSRRTSRRHSLPLSRLDLPSPVDEEGIGAACVPGPRASSDEYLSTRRGSLGTSNKRGSWHVDFDDHDSSDSSSIGVYQPLKRANSVN